MTEAVQGAAPCHYPADLQWRDGGFDTFCACGAAWPCPHHVPSVRGPVPPCDPEVIEFAMALCRLNSDPGDEEPERGWPHLYAAAEDILRHRAGEAPLPPRCDGERPTWVVGGGFRPSWLPVRYGHFVDYEGVSWVRRWDCTGPVFRRGQTVALDDRGELVETAP